MVQMHTRSVVETVGCMWLGDCALPKLLSSKKAQRHSLPPGFAILPKKAKPTGTSADTATVENSTEFPQKTENRVTIRPSSPTPGRIFRQNCNSKRYMAFSTPRSHPDQINQKRWW